MGIKHKPTQIKNVPVIYDLLTSPTLVNLNPCITINGKKHNSLSLKKPSSKTNYLYLILQKSIKNHPMFDTIMERIINEIEEMT